MQISLEIPLPHLAEFLPLTDFPFGLAHLCLGNSGTYVSYNALMKGCLLDNGMYEHKDEPLSNQELMEAASYCYPVAVIAPDWMDNAARTIEAVNIFRTDCAAVGTWSIGAVVQGNSLAERLECFYRLQGMHCRPVCFPFRTPRRETISHLSEQQAFRDDGWYHLLGLQRIEELGWKYPGRWSIDTGKPFKGVKMDDGGPIRGLGHLDLERGLNVEERIRALYNIAYMRKIANQEEANEKV